MDLFEREIDTIVAETHTNRPNRVAMASFFGKEGERLALIVSGDASRERAGGSNGSDVQRSQYKEDEVIRD